MQITMDSAGRVLIPKTLREEAHLQAGSKLEVSLRGGAIVLEPAPLEVDFHEENGLLVAWPTADPGSLRAEVADRTLDSVRSRSL